MPSPLAPKSRMLKTRAPARWSSSVGRGASSEGEGALAAHPARMAGTIAAATGTETAVIHWRRESEAWLLAALMPGTTTDVEQALKKVARSRHITPTH